jgi:D-cysteine desulfhydrase family pyridoxal phosphate-dependent enzyme
MKSIPRIRFAHLPTPVEAMPRLSAALGGPKLLVKRDDETGLAMGGNKTRKLEFLLAEAEANGAKTLITAGALQSNHCRQTAAAAARNGFGCILVLYTPTSQAGAGSLAPAASANLLLDQLFGAQIVRTAHEKRDQVLKETFQSAWEAGKRPYLIPYGGSNATGAAGYAFAIQEMIEQDIRPDWIVFPSSSGGTQAGLALGARLFGYAGHVLGISVDEEAAVLQQRVAKLATKTADLLGEKIIFSDSEILVNADYLGGGYGVMGSGEREAIELFARHEGLLLDPVYTGRAAAGMIDLIRKNRFDRDETVMFWHTGGSTALFADQYRAGLVPG